MENLLVVWLVQKSEKRKENIATIDMRTLTLYHYWRSSASWRVRWALAIKNIPYTAVAVNLLTAEEKQSTYQEKNPTAYVPCLQVKDGAKEYFLGESLAIIEWLEENYPTPSLLPGNSYQKAYIRQLAESINAGVQPLQNLDVTRHYSADKAKQEEWTRHWMARGLAVYEKLLEQHKEWCGDYSFGNTPSLADLCLIPQCASALRFNVDLSAYLRCKKIYEFASLTAPAKAASAEAHKPADAI